MHVEIQVALNFLISFLYNKLPRRRVNQFGEELEAALKKKFANHWYPNQPAKGSAYRCLKTANPLDPVFEIASRNCGLELSDVQEHLPAELSIWVDPGEVSYRMSEKSPVKLLCQKNELNGVAAKRAQSQYNQLSLSKSSTSEQNFLLNEPIESFMTNQNDNIYNANNANEVPDLIGSGNGSPGNSSNHSSTSSSVDSGFNDNGTNNDLNVRKFRTFNPEAQCFKPIESSNLLSSYNSQNSNQFSTNNLPLVNGYNFSLQQQQQVNQPQQQQNSFNSVSNQFSLSQSNNGFNNTPNNTSYCFSNKSTLKQQNTTSTSSTTAGFTKQSQTMTTAQFAQTKFGSTKLKTTTNNSNTGAICGINGTTKRNYTNRMSPTEFSNYIKQKAILQQQQHQQISNNTSQSSNNHQLSVPVNSGNYGFGNLFNGLSPQQSRAISPISNQGILSLPRNDLSIDKINNSFDHLDNFLLMAAAAAAVSTNSNTNTTNKPNLLNSNCNSIRNSLNLATNSTSPIAATNLPSLNSAGNSVCSSLNSNSGSLKLILNNNTTTNNLSSPSSAPAGDKLLSDINYLNELFNNTSLSPVMGNSSTIATTSSTNNLKQNRFNINENFIDFNSNEYTNYANTEFNHQQNINTKVNNMKKTSVENLGLISQNESKNLANESVIQQNANKPANGNEEKFDSFSLNNYPNQYQHLLVAN